MKGPGWQRAEIGKFGWGQQMTLGKGIPGKLLKSCGRTIKRPFPGACYHWSTYGPSNHLFKISFAVKWASTNITRNGKDLMV